MKSVIPFTKNLEFKTKISEITSISLEREFKLEKEEITGNLFVLGNIKVMISVPMFYLFLTKYLLPLKCRIT